jgi:hypothetical protein
MIEHNQTEWVDGRLTERLSQLAEINKPWQCAERLAQIQREMCIIAFESSERFRESKTIEVEEAWASHNMETV